MAELAASGGRRRGHSNDVTEGQRIACRSEGFGNVVRYGLALIDDPGRIGPVITLGLDETAFVRVGPYKHRLWSTQLVGDNQLLDVVVGRDAAGACQWLAQRPESWRAAIEWVTFDLAGSYRSVADTMLPDAQQVADPLQVVRAANERLDDVRRPNSPTAP